jgi:uncharacterized protein
MNMSLQLVMWTVIGGALVGAGAALLFHVNGRIAGVSGALQGTFTGPPGETGWRRAFIAGLVAGGALVALLRPDLTPVSVVPLAAVIPAGFLIGLGARLGNGCTSGHGICGVGRMSLRSITAVTMFTVTGILSLALARGLGVVS